MSIKNGNKVSIEYSLFLDDGSLVDSNVDKTPFIYEQGQNQIIKGLEERIEGLQEGDAKKFNIPPEEGYGLVDEEGFKEINKEKVPPESLEAGAMLEARDDQGKAIPVRVHEVKDDTVILDFNHPLAGRNLTFDIKILKVE